MKEIPLTQGKVALVDDYAYEFVSCYKWYTFRANKVFYAARTVSSQVSQDGKPHVLLLHHVIMGKPPEGLEIDHIDGNGLNNQQDNLKFVTHRINMQNHREHRNGKLVGANFHKTSGRWLARIQIDGKRKQIGYFKTEQEAHEAYEKACKQLDLGDK